MNFDINRMKYIANSMFERVLLWDLKKQNKDFTFDWTDTGIGSEKYTWEELPDNWKKQVQHDFIIYSGESNFWVSEMKKINYNREFFKKKYNEDKLFITKSKIQKLINETRVNHDKKYKPYIITFHPNGEFYFFDLLNIELISDEQLAQADNHSDFSTKEKQMKEVYWLDFNDATKYNLEKYSEQKTTQRVLYHCAKKTGIKEYKTLNIKKPS